MIGTVSKVTVSAGGNRIEIDKTDPPPPSTEELFNVPDWALTQFQTAIAGGKTVDVSQDSGGSVTAVTVG